MRLFVLERLMLQDILPREGSVTTLRIVRDLRHELGFSEEELKRMEIKEEGGGVYWNTRADEGKEIAIGEVAHDIIARRLREMDEKGSLKEQHLSLYERFVDGVVPDIVREAEEIARGS